jgi:hypothetical protein
LQMSKVRAMETCVELNLSFYTYPEKEESSCR